MRSSHNHVDYLLFGAAFLVQQFHAVLLGLGSAASCLLALAAILRAVTEMVRLCRTAPPPYIVGSRVRSLCPLARFCRAGRPGPPCSAHGESPNP